MTDEFIVKHGFISLVLLFLSFVFFIFMGFTYGRIGAEFRFASEEHRKNSSPISLVRYHRSGDLQLAVTPINLYNSDLPVEFQIALNDPAFELSKRNWEKIAILEDGNGGRWFPAISRHMEEGYVLAFNVTTSPTFLTLKIEGVNEDFSW